MISVVTWTLPRTHSFTVRSIVASSPGLTDSKWEKSKRCEHFYEGTDCGSGETKWMGSAVDLVFGSNSQLRAIAEVYGCDDSQEAFVRDFLAAWAKVMNLDRFDL